MKSFQYIKRYHSLVLFTFFAISITLLWWRYSVREVAYKFPFTGGGTPICLKFSPNGKLLAASNRSVCTVYSLTENRSIWEQKGVFDSSIAWSPDSSILVVSESNPSTRALQFIDSSTGQLIDKHQECVTVPRTDICIDESGTVFVTGGGAAVEFGNENGKPWVWTDAFFSDNKGKSKQFAEPKEFASLSIDAVSKSKNTYLAVSYEGQYPSELWRLESIKNKLTVYEKISILKETIGGRIKLSQNLNYAASIDSSGLHLFDINKKHPAQIFHLVNKNDNKSVPLEFHAIDFSKDSQLVAFVLNNRINVLRVSDQKILEVTKGVSSAALHFSPDSKLLAVSYKGEIQVYHITLQ